MVMIKRMISAACFMFFFMILVLCAGQSWAGELYGTIKEGGAHIGPNQKVEIKCGSETFAAQTDKFGSYKISVPKENEKCILTVQKGSVQATMDVFVHKGSVRYNLILGQDGNKYILKME